MYFVYILYSKSINKYYIGQTYSLEIRLKRHHLKTTQYTKRVDDWDLVYFEEFKTRSDAIKREKKIKRMKSRKYIEKLTSG